MKAITKEECKRLMMSVGRRLDASKGFATNHEVFFTLIYFKSTCSYTFAHLKKVVFRHK